MKNNKEMENKIKVSVLVKKYPESVNRLKNWLKDKFKDNDISKSIDSEVLKEFTLPDETLEIMINSNPRYVFDVFDYHQVVINTPYVNKEFKAEILVKDETVINYPDNFAKRIDAELFVLNLAFYQLEQILGNESTTTGN